MDLQYHLQSFLRYVRHRNFFKMAFQIFVEEKKTQHQTTTTKKTTATPFLGVFFFKCRLYVGHI